MWLQMSASNWLIILLLFSLILFGFYVLYRILLVVATIDLRLRAVERTLTGIDLKLHEALAQGFYPKEKHK